MTDRYFALTVILDGEIRDDDAEAIILAIKQIRNVKDVKPHVFDTDVAIAREQGKMEAVDEIVKTIVGIRKGRK